MSDQTAIQAYEAKKGNGPFGLFGSVSVLIVRILPFDPFPLENEMRHVNYHFMNWLSRHGAKCGELVLEFFAPISLRPAIEDHITRLLGQDCQYQRCYLSPEDRIHHPRSSYRRDYDFRSATRF